MPGRDVRLHPPGLPPTCSRSCSGGFTVLELVIALLLLGLVLQGGWSVFSTLRGAAEAAEVQARGLETVRTVGWVLNQELAGGRVGLDWWPGGEDTLGIRAFRGMALRTGRDPEGNIFVCYAGVRAPDPEKDSLLVLGIDGTWRASDLLERRAGEPGCWDGTRGRSEAWVVEEEGPQIPWLLARLFERGSYHLVNGALRYRRGGGGRQPITASNLEMGRFLSGVEPGSHLRWEVTLAPGGAVGSADWRGRVR